MVVSFHDSLLSLKTRFDGKNALVIQQLLDDPQVDSFEVLLERLESESRNDALIALWVLGQLGGKRHAPKVLKVVQGDQSELWMQAAVALGMLSSKRTVEPLMELLANATAEGQREAAAYALSFMEYVDDEPLEQVSDRFVEVLANKNEPAGLRAMIAEGLGNLHALGDKRRRAFKRAASGLLHALHDEAPELRFWSAFALGNMRVKSALERLRTMAQNDTTLLPGWWTVAEEAADAITLIEGGTPPDRQHATLS